MLGLFRCSCFLALADQSRDHVARSRVEVVARAVQIGGHQEDAGEPVLFAIGGEHHKQSLLGHTVGRVGLLGIPVPEACLRERHGGELRVGAHSTDLYELLHPATSGLLDHVQTHRHVGVEEAPRVVPVRTDPADLRGQMQHDVRLGLLEQPPHRERIGQVVLCASRNDHVLDIARTEQLTDRIAEKAGAAAHENSLAGQAQARRYVSVFALAQHRCDDIRCAVGELRSHPGNEAHSGKKAVIAGSGRNRLRPGKRLQSRR